MQKKNSLKGYIHSTESFGTVDGPGVRFVLFFQGCPMRCLYCHNPDTWKPGAGTERTVPELLEEYRRNEVFYRSGGITATGGEPLMQLPFLTELFEAARAEGIHTCLDTSGILYRSGLQPEYDRLFRALNLVLLDIKHSDEEAHRRLTGQSQHRVLEFARALEAAGIPMIVRHVVVPGITDGTEHLKRLGRLIAGFRNLKGLEILPYHTMGISKYRQLQLPYPLEGTESLEAGPAKAARRIVLEAFYQTRNAGGS